MKIETCRANAKSDREKASKHRITHRKCGDDYIQTVSTVVDNNAKCFLV